jgi:hypothetical protein
MTSSTLLPPRLLSQKEGSSDGLECSVHTLPKPLMREFHHVFGDQYLHVGAGGELLAVPTNQRAREDLVAIGDHIEQEKDRLLNVVRLLVNIGNGFLPYYISFFYVSTPTVY